MTVAERNEITSPHAVFTLSYILDIQVQNEKIYLLTSDLDPGGDGFNSQILIYNFEGELLSHLAFIDEDNSYFLYDFIVMPDNEVFFIDILNAQILKYKFEL